MKSLIISELEKKRILNLHECYRKKTLNEDYSGTPHEGYDSEESCKRNLPYDVVEKAGLSWEEVKKSWGSDGSSTQNLELRDAFCDGWRPEDSKNNEDSESEEYDFDTDFSVKKQEKNKETKPKEDKKTKFKEDLPQKIKSAIDKLKTDYGLNITQKHIDKEFEQEGSWRPDNGGVNKKAQSKINQLIKDCKSKFPKVKGGIVSGYRSYDDQIKNFGNKASTRGIDDTQRANTLPGFSQHHTGRAFDIFDTETTWWDNNSDVKKWVAENAKNYGFDVTYKKQGPLRIAEPWHLYYTD